jgi:hypothetical protein
VGQFEICSPYHFDKFVPSCLHGEKESKEKVPQKEESAET